MDYMKKQCPLNSGWKEKLEKAAKFAHYDYVELSIDSTEEKINRIYMSKEERLSLIQNMYEVGIPVRSNARSALTKYSLGSGNAKLRERGMEILEKAIELADDLGIRIIMIPGYDVYYEESTSETQKRFSDNLQTTGYGPWHMGY